MGSRWVHRIGLVGLRAAPWLLAGMMACSSGSGSSSLLLPQEFPKDQVVSGAGAVRITRPALDLVAEIFPGLAKTLLGTALDADGIYWVDIPTSTSTGVTICPDGPKPNTQPPECRAEVDLTHADLHLDPTNPNLLVISGAIPVRIRDLPVKAVGLIPFGIGLGTNPGCDGNTPNVDEFSRVEVDIRLPLVAETIAPRQGLMRIDGTHATVKVNLNQPDLKGCLLNFDISWVLQLASATILNTLQSTIQEKLATAFCASPDPAKTPPCPSGSQPDDPDLTKATKCLFDADPSVCVAPLFGMEGRLDGGSLLKAYSPSTRSLLDLIVAAWGQMDPAPGEPSTGPKGTDLNYTPNGATINLGGGMLPATKASCVAPVDNPPPTGIPVLDELRADTYPGQSTQTYELGLGLSERFLNYALKGAYNSGLLCARVETSTIPALNTGLLSLLAPSIRSLSLEQKPAAAVIATRPSKPLELQLGAGTDVDADPLLKIAIPGLFIDFYVWSYDRFVRALTLQADVQLGVNIDVQTDPQTQQTSIVPFVGTPTISSIAVTNSELLTENPEGIATAVQGVIGQFLSEIGAVSPIAISDLLASYGLALVVKPGGILKLSKGNDDFLALFAGLAKLPAPTSGPAPHGSAKLLEKRMDRGSMKLSTLSSARLPSLHLALASDLDAQGVEVEYAVAFDRGSRGPWFTAKDTWVTSPVLAMQGRHELRVVARVAGQPETMREAPERIPFTIDAIGPHVSLSRAGRSLQVHTWDFVSETAALQGRVRVDSGDWQAWSPIAELQKVDVSAANLVDVEVRDEEGNVTPASLSFAPAVQSASCSCSTQGTSGGGGGIAALLAIAAAMAARGRRGSDRKPAALPSRRRAGQHLRAAGMLAGLGTVLTSGCGQTYEDPVYTACGADCHRACLPALPQGILGAYTSVAVSGETLWVAGYNDRATANGQSWAYGDLVVGPYDRGTGRVAWATVDGLPAARTDGTCVDYDTAGWRGGNPETGPNVGLWTSVQVAADGTVLVAYYDMTQRALRFAYGTGSSWKSYQLMAREGADVGRYAKMILQDGKPVVAWLSIERAQDGRTLSRIEVARTAMDVPTDSSQWELSTAIEESSGSCMQSLCASGETCIAATGVCTAVQDSCPCDGGACYEVDGSVTCAPAPLPASEETYPPGVGVSLSLAATSQGTVIVAWDRVHGALIALRQNGGGYDKIVLDQPADGSAGLGLGASIVVGEDGAWNVSYGDDAHAAVRYVRVANGTPSAPEVVDDGTPIQGVSPELGRWIGDDTSLMVDSSGVVTVFYQDATAGVLRMAVGQPSGGGAHTWTRSVLEQPQKFGGFFAQAIGATREVASFWKSVDPADPDRNGDVSILPVP